MKAVWATRASRGELQYGDIPAPKPGANGVLIRVHGSSLNPHDWKYHAFLRHLYRVLWPLPLPRILLGHDVSGVVEAVGKRVREFEIGDEVFVMTALPGAFAEYVAVDRRMVAHKPTSVTHLEAATIPMAGLTALQALRMAGLRPGHRVLVIGGSGGVGVMALQIAKAQGAHVTGVCSSRNVELVRSLGADKVIDYTQDDPTRGSETYDIVFDTIGNESVRSCAAILAAGGCFISTATSVGNVLRAVGSVMFAYVAPGRTRCLTLLALPWASDMRALRRMVDDGQIRPVVDEVYELQDLQAAIAYSRTGRVRGKIALRVADVAPRSEGAP